MTIPRFKYVFCPKYNLLMAYYMIWQAEKKVYSCSESYIQENRLYKLCTVVSEVSSFVGNPVFLNLALYLNLSNFVLHKKGISILCGQNFNWSVTWVSVSESEGVSEWVSEWVCDKESRFVISVYDEVREWWKDWMSDEWVRYEVIG